MPRKDRTFSGQDVVRIAFNNLEPEELDYVILRLTIPPGLEEQDPVEIIIRIIDSLRLGATEIVRLANRLLR